MAFKIPPSQVKVQQPLISKPLPVIQSILNITFVGDMTGESMQVEDVNCQTTFLEIALKVVRFLRVKNAKFSFVAENGNAINFELNKQGLIQKDGEQRVELLTGFYNSGLSCKFDYCVKDGQILIYVEKCKDPFVIVPYNPNETVLELKKK
ncbi:MAG: hypothetical protein EZS28_043855, partial [Streblomastix strix]